MASLTIRRILPPIFTSRARAELGRAGSPATPVRGGNGAVTVIRLAVVILTIAAVVAAVGAVRTGDLGGAPRYRTETVSRGAVTGVVLLPGQLTATATVRVGVERPGKIEVVEVTTGDRVERGQVLARMDARDLRAQASGALASALAAQVSARQAEVRLGQLMYLLQNGEELMPRNGAIGGVRPGELEAAALEAEANLVTAAAELKKQASAVDTARTQVSRSVLRAPVTGVIMSRAIEPGEVAAPGAALFVVAADPTELDLVTTVAEADVPRVGGGRASFIVPAYPERVFTARVMAVDPGPVGEQPPFRYRVRLRAQNPLLALRPGMSATVTLDLASPPEALRVPVEALRFAPPGEASSPSGRPPTSSDGARLYVLESGRLRREPVEVGVSDGKLVEVRRTALEPGAAIVVAAR